MKHGRQKGSKGWRFQPRSKGGRGYFSEDVVNAHGADDWETGSQSLAGFTAIFDDEPYESITTLLGMWQSQRMTWPLTMKRSSWS